MSKNLQEHDKEHSHTHHHEDDCEHGALPCDGAGHTHHHHADGSCCCHHHEMEFHGPNKVMLARLAVSVVLYLCGMLLSVSEQIEMLLMIAAALIAGYDIVVQAAKNLIAGSFFDEYFLMTVAAIAACLIGEYEEGAAVMVLYRVGETCQDYAIRHSRRTLAHYTHGAEEGGCGETEKFITRFAKIYTPIILAAAVAVALLLPLLDRNMGFRDSIYRALSFLVLACPCAIVISVPLTYFAGISAAAKKKVFFHDSTAIDTLAKSLQPEENFSQQTGEEGPFWTYSGQSVIVDAPERNAVGMAVELAKHTRRIAFENIIFVIAVKVAVIILSLCGISSLWFAVFADSGVAVLTILNALRAFTV